MIPASQVAKAANKELAEDTNEARKHFFLTSHAISPPHGDTQNWREKGGLDIPLEGTTFGSMTKKAATPLAPFSKMVSDDRTYEVGFVKFKAVETNTEGQIGSITFPDPKYGDELTDTPSRAGYIPIWFLPWKSGRMLRMKLPSKNTAVTTNSGTALPNPDLFFTAAINGCSVFAYGDPSTPTVAHGGIGYNFPEVLDKETLDALGGDGAAFWRNLLNGVTFNKGKIQLNPTPKVRANLGEVNQYDYVRQKKGEQTVLSTKKSEEIEEYFKNNRKDQITAVVVIPWGSVCGVRSATGQWRFILQRNMSVTYTRVRRVKPTIFHKAKFVPEGNPQQTSILVGYEEFFPGGGVASTKNLDSLQLY